MVEKESRRGEDDGDEESKWLGFGAAVSGWGY
jgi:hypothetical protein